MIRTVLLIFVVFALLPQDACCQDATTANLSWEFIRMDNRTTGDLDERGGTIRTYGTNRVEWYNHRGVLKQTFVIGDINGSWRDVSHDGYILYEGETEGNQGTVTLEREGATIRITIVVLKDGELPMVYEFTIQNITTL